MEKHAPETLRYMASNRLTAARSLAKLAGLKGGEDADIKRGIAVFVAQAAAYRHEAEGKANV